MTIKFMGLSMPNDTILAAFYLFILDLNIKQKSSTTLVEWLHFTLFFRLYKKS